MTEEQKTPISTSNPENVTITGGDVEVVSMPHVALANEEQIMDWISNNKLANHIIGENGKNKVTLTNPNLILTPRYEYNNASQKDKNISSSVEVENVSDNKFDGYFKEIKDDMREREARTREEIKEREQRFERSMDKYSEDSKERENRFYDLVNDIKKDTNEYKQEVKQDISALKKDFEKTQDRIEKSLDHLESMKRTTFWGQIAFLAAIAAIIVTMIFQL